MKKLLFPVLTLILTGTVLSSCDKGDEPETEKSGYHISEPAIDPGTNVPGNI